MSTLTGIHRAILVAVSAAMLAACSGGSGGASGAAANSNPSALPQEPGAPQATGNTAADGFNWFNFRRRQAGLPELARNALIDKAAQAHSTYQTLNGNKITHDETRGNPGYTGNTFCDASQGTTRMEAAGYYFGIDGGICGEVISESSSSSGMIAAENLITAIYHRFVIFEPLFREAGAGFATGSTGRTFLTVDFAGKGFAPVLGKGNFVVYPYPGQANVPGNFFSDSEEPDPVPDKNEVGYPISIHADAYNSSIKVTSFTVRPRGGANLPVRLLTQDTDSNMQGEASEAAIVPLSPLARGTVYDVQFVGSVDGVPATRDWSFTTQ